MNWSDIDGWFDFADVYDEQVERADDGAVFVEVGLYKGRSCGYLATAIRDSGKRIALYGVDPFPRVDITAAAFLENMAACGVGTYVTLLHMPSVTAAKAFADGAVDFVYIDGWHNYESVRDDIAAWRPKVKCGGTIGGHDGTRKEVTRAVTEAFGEYERMGPLSWLVRL